MKNDWQLTIYALLLRPDEETVFVNEEGLLPHTQVQAESWWHVDAGKPIIQSAIEQLLGVSLIILRRFAPEDVDNEAKTARIVYEIDEVQPQCAGNWISAEKLQTHHNLAKTQLALPNTTPWMRHGWHANAIEWINAQIDSPITKIEPFRSWCISYLAKVYTDSAEIFYFKATIELPLFVNEGNVMAGLHQLYPSLVPTPIAVDPVRNFLILPDFGESTHDGVYDLETRTAILREIVVMQRDSAEKLPAMLDAGCIDRTLDDLLERMTERWQDPTTFAGLNTEESNQLQTALPELQRACQSLIDSPLPTTLIHGDLHEGNIHLNGDKMTIFDWSDAAIGFPWIDALLVFFAPEDQREPICDIYLSYWEEYAPLEQLRKLWEIWQPLFYIHQAISYISIFENIDPTTKWELGGDAAEFLRGALKFLA